MKNCAETMQAMMEHAGYRHHDKSLDQYDWENHIYRSNLYRRGHVEVVDKTATHGIYILHATVFPHIDDPSPIWGFDCVCGKNKITGAFHDFSLVTEQHYMHDWFSNTVKDIAWNKQRTLPEWAQNIFSPAMVAAGNISEQHELDNIVDLGIKTLDYYLHNVGDRMVGVDARERQNYYCQNQKLNPHVYRSMIAMGVSETTIKKFVEEVLFPEVG
jgi:hypothetical protein